MGNLNQRLERYYDEYVVPTITAKNLADRAYLEVKQIVQKYLNKHVKADVTLVDVGSATDDLQVVLPSHYDVLMVVDAESLDAVVDFMPGNVDGAANLGYKFLKEFNSFLLVFPKEGTSTRNLRVLNDSLCIEKGYLSPDKVTEAFHKIVRQCVNSHTSPQVGITLKGKGIKAEVCYGLDYGETLVIDFVPALQINGTCFEAKPHPLCTMVGSNPIYKYLWRKSYHAEEADLVDKYLYEGSNHKKALMLLKASQLVHPRTMGILSSYHLKTVALEYAYTHCYSWDNLHTTLDNMVKALIKKLRKGCIKNMFDRQVNMILHLSQGEIQELTSFLEDVQETQNYEFLLAMERSGTIKLPDEETVIWLFCTASLLYYLITIFVLK